VTVDTLNAGANSHLMKLRKSLAVAYLEILRVTFERGTHQEP
jgi:hypothetical protein